MDSTDQVESPAWSLWTKLATPVLLRCPVLGISAVLVVSTPLAAMARILPRSTESASAEPTQRQLHVLRSYERYLARMRAQTVKAGRAVKFAYRQVGKPYQWGGAGPRTYDCSGLVMAAWRKGGLRLPHRADLQHRVIGRKVRLSRLRPGDLVFFSGDHHVGIYVGRHHFLHAPHTGARVQQGTLAGWRLRAFAGAARPGAPAYHAWPHWVRSLAGHGTAHHHGAITAHVPHGSDPAALTAGPDITRPDDAPPAEAFPGSGDDADDQTSGTGLDPVEPYDALPAPPAPPAGPPRAIRPEASAPPPALAAPPVRSPAAKVPVARPYPPVPASAASGRPAPSVPREEARPAGEQGGSVIPLLTMAGHVLRVRHHTVAAKATPVPRPEAPRTAPGSTRPAPRWPRSSVQHRNDEQRFDRDYDNSAPDEDDDSGNDGIDLRSLLGVAP